jgi:tRNA G18 (ribose-2'-O)-methylase SpoU
MSCGKQLRGDSLFSHQRIQAEKIALKNPAPDIICDGIQTPQNFGSILRVADALGCKNIILLDSELDLSHKKISRIARSTEHHLNISQCSLQDFLIQHKRYHSLYALEITSESCDLFDYGITDCDGIVIGHESQGVRQALLDICLHAVHLPMYGINSSMNVSHALAVFLYEWRRQQ